MKLLDLPIRKQAADNKEAIIKLLAGAGIGSAAGAISEYASTGKLGWRGALAGGALGVGTAAAVDPAIRQRISQAYHKYRGTAPAEATPATAAAPELYHDQVAGLKEQQQATPAATEPIQEILDNADERRYGGVRMAHTLYNDPQYAELMRDTAAADGLNSKEGVDALTSYARYYKGRKGAMPSAEHLGRFNKMRSTLPPDQWASYMDDTHDASGVEEGSAAQVYGVQAVGNKALQGINLARNPAARAAAKKAIASPGAWSKLKSVLSAGKLTAKQLPLANELLDAPELLIDSVTGKYTMPTLKNLGHNITQGDRLMETREKHGRMITPLDILPDKHTPEMFKNLDMRRNTLYNLGWGGLRGRFNPQTTRAIAGNRAKDLAVEQFAAAKRAGLEGLTNQAKSQWGAVAETANELSPMISPLAYLLNKGDLTKEKVNWGQSHGPTTAAEILAHRRKTGIPQRNR